jgi:hypothetical protein
LQCRQRVLHSALTVLQFPAKTMRRASERGELRSG